MQYHSIKIRVCINKYINTEIPGKIQVVKKYMLSNEHLIIEIKLILFKSKIYYLKLHSVDYKLKVERYRVKRN
jgi:hypothetical protein